MLPSVGVIGFGIVGKATTDFLIHYWNELPFTTFSPSPSITIWDQRDITESEKNLFLESSLTYSSQKTCSLAEFIENNRFVIPSPSIDMRPFEKHRDKIICELDLFRLFCKKPTIAITGSIGKTSTRRITAELLSQLPYCDSSEAPFIMKAIEAGNIGTGLLGTLEQVTSSDIVVLELSSFQLEYNTSFAPDIALITNLHPNHLDRHATVEDYLEKKLHLILFQKTDQIALLPTSLLYKPLRDITLSFLAKSKAKKCFIHSGPFDENILSLITPFSDTLFFMTSEGCSLWYQGSVNNLIAWKQLPSITFRENWLSIISMLYTLGYDLSLLRPDITLNLEPHRLEYCGVINGIECYNDSKATIIEATHAALTKLSANQKPIILIVGGVNHAGNRELLASRLHTFPFLKKIICFGNECSFFPSATVCTTLDIAFETALTYAKPGDQILFSPNGAGTDFFINYAHRGNAFKHLVERHKETSSTMGY